MSITAIERPSPPDGLTDEQSIEWRAVVDRMPGEWFPPETHGMLAQFCRHVVSARHVAELTEKLLSSDAFDLETYNKLLIMQEREGRALSSLATRMRITNQTRFSKDKKTGPMGPKPWTPPRK